MYFALGNPIDLLAFTTAAEVAGSEAARATTVGQRQPALRSILGTAGATFDQSGLLASNQATARGLWTLSCFEGFVTYLADRDPHQTLTLDLDGERVLLTRGAPGLSAWTLRRGEPHGTVAVGAYESAAACLEALATMPLQLAPAPPPAVFHALRPGTVVPRAKAVAPRRSLWSRIFARY
jgi:hypothetical protein